MQYILNTYICAIEFLVCFDAFVENLVFLKIKHKNPHYYRKGEIEIDFIFDDWLIEAKYGQELEGKQKKRAANINTKKEAKRDKKRKKFIKKGRIIPGF